MIENVGRLHAQLEAAGIPIHGVDQDGKVNFREGATAEQRAAAEQIVLAYDPVIPSAGEKAISDALDAAKGLEGTKPGDLTTAQIKVMLGALLACHGWIAEGMIKF